jgi:tetratricopeptide (TPR) repeat protein
MTMRNIGTLTSVLLLFTLVALATSCSILPRGAGLTGAETKIIDDTVKRAQEQVAHGEYKKALEIYSNTYDKYHHPGLRYNFAETGGQVRNAADAAYQKRQYAEAGNIYRILFESGITIRDFAASLSFDDDYLSSQISACSKALTEIGLLKYREEKIDEAISIWEKVLAFDPDNKAVIKAVDTATKQMQKLKSIK